MLLQTAAFFASWSRRTPDQPDPDVASVFDQSAAGSDRPSDVPPYEWERRAHFYTKLSSSGTSIAERCAWTLKNSTVTAMHSCVESLVSSRLGKPLVPLGLLPPSPDGGRVVAGSTNDGGDDDATVRWLDAQPAALGSEVPLRVDQVHELALGLELAGTRFLWALRKPTTGVVDDEEAVLPPGFQDRTRNRGTVATGWVPQLSILAHSAVGAFLTHGGRNSLIEGLMFGHPLVMLPIRGDQGSNARLMEGKKVGVQVPRGESDGSFDRHGVASTIGISPPAVRAVCWRKREGEFLLANAVKMQKIVADKELHERYIDEFVQYLRSHIAEGRPASTPLAEA